MTQKRDWKKPFAIILFITLLGGYYDRLGVEARTMVLPLAIFIAAGMVITHLKKLEYEIRSFKVNAREVVVQAFSVIDSNGRERVSISTIPDTPLMTFFDENHIPLASLQMIQGDPSLKLTGGNGSIHVELDGQRRPNLSIRDEEDKIIWSAP